VTPKREAQPSALPHLRPDPARDRLSQPSVITAIRRRSPQWFRRIAGRCPGNRVSACCVAWTCCSPRHDGRRRVCLPRGMWHKRNVVRRGGNAVTGPRLLYGCEQRSRRFRRLSGQEYGRRADSGRGSTYVHPHGRHLVQPAERVACHQRRPERSNACSRGVLTPRHSAGGRDVGCGQRIPLQRLSAVLDVEMRRYL